MAGKRETNYPNLFSFALNDEQLAWLDSKAEEEDRSRSSMLRQIIKRAMAKDGDADE